MMQVLFVLLSLLAWVIVSVGCAALWGEHRNQQGWNEGFNEGFDSGYVFAGELRKEGQP